MERFEGTAAMELVRGSVESARRVTAFLKAVYGWMCAGLAITALVAYSIASAPALVQVLVTNHLLFLALFVAQIALVFFLSARVDTLAPATATILFVAYAAVTGVTLAVLVLAYTEASIATTFVVTAGMFGALALYGSTTMRSLAGAGQWRCERALDGLLLVPELRLGPRDDGNEARVDIGSDRSSGSHPPGRLTLAIHSRRSPRNRRRNRKRLMKSR